MAIHTLGPEHGLVGYFDPATPPVLSVASGDVVRLATLDSGWHMPEQDAVGALSDLARWPDRGEHDTGHALCGPIEVRGARPGQWLRIRIRSVRTGSWGWGGSGAKFLTAYYTRLGRPDSPGFGLGWTLDADAGIGRSHLGDTVRLRPFPGVLGMPPPEPGRHSTVPPRRWGGNLDCRELVAGSTLWLPVPVEGAMLHVGDGHATQGDGEVSGVAIECPLAELELELELWDAVDWPESDTPVPHFRTPAGLRGTLAVAGSLDDAFAEALDAMLRWVVADTGLEEPHVLGLASVLADLRITQVVNGTVGVHCLWREDRIPPAAAP